MSNRTAITTEAVTETLHAANAIAADEIVTHAVMVVATVRYDDNGRRISRVHEIVPAGMHLDGYVMTGLLHSALDYRSAASRSV